MKTNLRAVGKFFLDNLNPGLSEELREHVEKDVALECVLKLNSQVQVVKDKHAQNRLAHKCLDQAFELLEATLDKMKKDTNSSSSVQYEKKGTVVDTKN